VGYEKIILASHFGVYARVMPTISDAEEAIARGDHGRCIQILFAILQSPSQPPMNRLEESLVCIAHFSED
jgi:hypothetical protein